MKKILIIILFIPLLCYSQNKNRLALVIGNANYAEGGELKNPSQRIEYKYWHTS